jgi:hypothetical protein
MKEFLRKLPRPARLAVKILLGVVLASIFLVCAVIVAAIAATAVLQVYTAIAGPPSKAVSMIAFLLAAGVTSPFYLANQQWRELKAWRPDNVKWLNRAWIAGLIGCLLAKRHQVDFGDFWASVVAVISLAAIAAYGLLLLSFRRRVLRGTNLE